MSTSDADISATLNDMEIENLMSLLQEDTILHDLNKLDLPEARSFHPVVQSSCVQPNGGTAINSSELDFLEFHDALDFFSDGINTEAFSYPNVTTAVSAIPPRYPGDTGGSYDYSSQQQADCMFSNFLDPNNGCQSHLYSTNNVFTGTLQCGGTYPTVGTLLPTCTPAVSSNLPGTLPTTTAGYNSNGPDIATMQTIVDHDHTYAKKEEKVNNGLSNGGNPCMLSTLSGPSVTVPLSLAVPPSSSDGNSGKNSDCEEGSGSDTGYDTLDASPASTRSSFSSTRELIDSAHPQDTGGSSALFQLKEGEEEEEEEEQPLATSGPVSLDEFTQLVKDPVKLIDERIKFFMSRQEVHLTEEEKDTLKSEGLPIPTTLPLTKTEEKALKTVRRKIRNKLAAQESRKKKKEYMHCLEEQVQKCTKENRKLHRKVETLETENRTLLQQLAHLQALVARANPILGRQMSTGTCLMVVILCFGVLFGNLLPYRVSVATANADYSTSAVKSRSLLSTESSSQWMNWVDYYKNLLLDYRDSSSVHHSISTNSKHSIINTLWTPQYNNNSIHCL